VRIFEWNGPMLHAKSAVADGHWARVGSTNLNLASWIGNWEMDVAVENPNFAEAMERMYLQDLEHSTEVVLDVKHRPKPVRRHIPERQRDRRRRSSTARVAAGSLGIGNTVGAAITNRRALGPAEAGILGVTGAVLLLVAVIAIFFPRLIAIPVTLLGLIVGISLVVRAWKLHRRTRTDHLQQK
jgi:cardiolipin synthase